jgi:hypothetical protein
MCGKSDRPGSQGGGCGKVDNGEKVVLAKFKRAVFLSRPLPAPSNEAQVRPLTKLETVEAQREAWEIGKKTPGDDCRVYIA